MGSTIMNSPAKTLPWLRLLAEGTAIVIGILLAFGIDAWWDERVERIEEQNILAGLEEEFLLIRDVLTAHRALHLRRLDALAALLSTVDADSSGVTTELLAAVMDELLAPTTSDIGNGTLHALLGSGRLEILSNRTLRQHLVAWESAIGEVWDDQLAHAKLVHEHHLPYFIREGYGFGDVNRLWYGEPRAPMRSLGDDPAQGQRLLADPEFLSMVEAGYLYKQHLTEEFDLAIVAVDEILDEIRISLRRD